MFSYLDDKAFVDFVLEKGSIPFVVRGSLACSANFNFAPFVGIRISGPTYHIHVIGENPQQQGDAGTIYVRELNDEAVFPGEIELPERTELGISKALYGLELWADFVCLAVGNPKIIVEIQRPMNAIITARSNFDLPSLDRWGSLFESYSQLETNERRRLAGVIWWYRKACSTAYYSIFDSYTAYWNCLEIMCNVAGSKVHKGAEADDAIQKYLKGKDKIKAGHILHCYNNFVNYSIKEQMKDALKDLIGEEQASQVTCQCFEIKPEEDRLYQIRNDINHGNIRENSGPAYERVYFRGMLLWNIVMELLYRKLGHPISVGMNINALAEKLANPAFRKGES
jgi:hypothetical protein